MAQRRPAASEFLTRQLPPEVFLARCSRSHPAYERSLRAASELEVCDSGIASTSGWSRSATPSAQPVAHDHPDAARADLGAARGRPRPADASPRARGDGAGGRKRSAKPRKRRRARAAAEREERRAAFLAAAGQELAASLDYEQTIATLARLIVPNLAEICVDRHVRGGRRAAPRRGRASRCRGRGELSEPTRRETIATCRRRSRAS